jgi:hypothetical protein
MVQPLPRGILHYTRHHVAQYTAERGLSDPECVDEASEWRVIQSCLGLDPVCTPDFLRLCIQFYDEHGSLFPP